ncbi:MAG: MEDS domain-containing protein [Bdellovibrionota bacterium]
MKFAVALQEDQNLGADKTYAPRRIQNIELGEHVLWLCSATDDPYKSSIELAERAISEKQALLYLYHLRNPRKEFLTHSLPLDAAVGSGQIRFLPAYDVFLADGMFRPDDAIGELNKQVDQALKAGFSGLRIVVEMTWVFEAALGAARISEFEHKLEDLLIAKRCLVIAQYHRQYFKPALLLDLLSSYPSLLIGSDLYENFYFVPPDHALVEQHQAAVLHQSLETLKALGRAETLINERSVQLQQSEAALEMLHSIIDSMGDGVFVVDENGYMLFCNKSSEHIIGYGLLDLPLEERVRLIGNYLPDGVTPYPVEDLPISRAIAGESSDDVVYIVRNPRRPNGVWISVNGRPLRDRNGRIKGGVLVFRDISKQKRAEEEQERLEEQMFRTQKLESLGVLAGGIAHDFNNLLMGVLGNADLALLEAEPDSPLEQRVSQIRTAARRLSGLTNQLLAYSGKGPVSQEKLNLSVLVQEMGDLLRPAISKRAVVDYSLAKDLPPMLADATQIRQVVMNLITNASDAIGEGSGTITIRTGLFDAPYDYLKQTYLADHLSPGKFVFLDVSDTGCGMSEETVTKIFDPFFTTKFTGRGLGLAAVLGIVRRHGGALKVDSLVGQGTTFRVLFPAAEGDLDPAARKPVLDGTWRGSGVMLVVDDEEAVREIAAEMLSHLGFEVLLASSGRQALHYLETPEYKIRGVLLDITMPDMDGETVLNRMSGLDGQVKVIVSSGFHQADMARRFHTPAVAGYLQKPYGREQLSTVLQHAFSPTDGAQQA